jgi:hypothetical protein
VPKITRSDEAAEAAGLRVVSAFGTPDAVAYLNHAKPTTVTGSRRCIEYGKIHPDDKNVMLEKDGEDQLDKSCEK